MNSDYAAASQSSAEDLNVDDDGDSEETISKILCRAMMAKWRKVIQATEEDVEMTTQSDDEYDTLESRVQLVDLIAQDPTQTVNHNLNQVTQSLVSGIPLDYIQPAHHDNSPLASRVFDDIFHVQKRLLQHLPRCILLSNHLHVS